MVGFRLHAMAVGGVISAFALSGWGVRVGRVLAGIGCLFALVYSTKMIEDWFEGREIATAMSVLMMSWPFEIAIGQVRHAWLAQAYGCQVLFQVASAYCLIAALAVFAFYRPPHGLPLVNTGSPASRTRQEWRLVLCAATALGEFNAAYVTYFPFGPKDLEVLGQSVIAAAGINSIGSWTMILLAPAVGRSWTALGDGTSC